MKRKVLISLIVSQLIGVGLCAQSLTLKQGWNLLGTDVDSVSTSSIANASVKTLWSWDSTNKKWKAFSTDNALENKIGSLVSLGTLSPFGTLNKGDGFWANATNATTLTLDGTSSSVSSKVLSGGWNLVSFSGTAGEDIAEVFKNNGQIKTVWTYKDGKWKGWSPSSYINGLIKNIVGEDNIIDKIEPNQGYWINAQMATNIAINLTSSSQQALSKNLIFVYQNGSVGSIIPVSDATLLVNGSVIGKTDSNGYFDFGALNLPDGTAVTVKKDGYTTTTGKIQRGALTITISPLPLDGLTPPSQPNVGTNGRKLNKSYVTIQKSTGDEEIPLPTIVSLNADGGTMEMSGSSSVSSVTVFLNMYNTPSEAPMITNTLNVGGKQVLPKELSIIGGAHLTLRKPDASLVTDLTAYNETGLSYSLILDRFIGDFGKIIEGLTGSTIVQQVHFNDSVVDKLKAAKEKGLIDFYLIRQLKDGSWTFVDTAKFVKTSTGYVMRAENIDKLDQFGSGNIAYVIRSKALTGTTKVCLTYDGERMFDGTILGTTLTGQPVEGAMIVPDEHVISQPAPTGGDGCTNVEYKVPFLAPMYNITAVKQGIYNEPVTVEIEYGNLNKEQNEKVLQKPKDASIKGYVRSTYKNNTKNEANAIVALRDPQILVPSKIKVVSSEDNNSIQLLAMPNLTYTWKLSKDDSNASVTIKSGDADGGKNVLKESDIEDIIYSGESDKNPWVEKPYGHYYIDVTVKHDYAQGTQASFTEAMRIEFDAQVDEIALINAFQNSNNQGDAPVYKVDENGTVSIVKDISTSGSYATSKELGKAKVPFISVFGGKDLGWFEPVMRPANPTANIYQSGIIAPDHTKWITDVMSLESNTSDKCIDMGENGDPDDVNNPHYKYLVDTYASKGDCIQKVTPKTTFSGQILPFSQVYKMFMDDYKDVIAPDPGYNDKPFYESGFTVVNTYYADFNRTNSSGNVYKTWVPSYVDLPSEKFTKVSDFSNVINFAAKPNEAIAFDTRIAKTDGDGSYRIDHIAPPVIPYLELMARAERTKYNTKNFRKANFPDGVYTGNLDSNVSGASDTYDEYNGQTDYTPQAGDVLVHNFMLDRMPPKSIDIGFENNLTDNQGENWTVKKLDISNAYINTSVSDSVKWQVVEDNSLPTVNSEYLSYVFDGTESNMSILPTPYGSKYAWMGDVNTGTYSDSGNLNSDHQVATALVSPVIDFSNFSLATLQLKTWFEVSGIDAAWDTAFIGFEIVDDNTSNNQSQVTLTYYNGFQWTVKLNQTYIHKLTPTAPVVSSWDTKTFSNMGVNAEPRWVDYKLPLDFLAGHKAKVVFGFFTADNLYNNYRGWGIDNVEIKDNVDYVIQTPPMPDIFEENLINEQNGTVVVVDNNTTE